ncbi:MarR family winged helix-turn-helix transcriptional regulator [Kitasatospora sp. NPDC002551]|uniref:MarR family winged helix-turn-helix transcriptional regulator n=1 Tax=Kitasatospora sp. NPDC002551 TaxID=3154539 RepID=UPI003324B40D
MDGPSGVVPAGLLVPGQRSAGWRSKIPTGLSARMRALVVEGAGMERYREGGSDGGSGAGRDTHRVTSAIAFGFARAGADQLALRDVLLASPAPGGALLRDLSRAKGHDHAMRYLDGVWRRAVRVTGESAPIRERRDAMAALAERRIAVEVFPWRGQAGQTDRANLLHRLGLCERAGGFDHEVSQRQLALGIGVGESTVKRSDARLVAAGWLWRAERGGAGASSKWVLGRPRRGSADVVSPVDPNRQVGHEAPGYLDGVNRRHTPATTPAAPSDAPAELDFRLLSDLMTRDAFRARGLGKTAAEVVAALAYRDGQTAVELAASTRRHRATVHARLAPLMEHGLVVKTGELYYLADGLLDAPAKRPHGSRLPTWKPVGRWDDVAADLGVFGASYRQWCLYAFDRIAADDVYRRVREHARPARPATELTDQDWAFLNTWTTDLEDTDRVVSA